jgi:hypothetical protein
MHETDEGNLREAIRMALRSYQGADERWRRFFKGNPSDAELLEQIGEEFGSYGGFCGGGMRWNCHGGRNPFFEHLSDHRRPSVWKGRALAALAREVLTGYIQAKLPSMEAL